MANLNRIGFLVRRFAWAAFVFYLVLSSVFFAFVWVPDNTPVGFGLEPDKAEKVREQYRDRMHYDEPILQRYANWLEAYTTLDLGRSYVQQRPVRDILAAAAPWTLLYVVPAVALSFALGTGFGVFSALRPDHLATRLGNAVVYSSVSVPVFWAGEIALFLLRYDGGVVPGLARGRSPLALQNLLALSVPTLILTANLLAVQVRYARSEASEYVAEDFVDVIRAKGGTVGDVARHIVRNVSIPLASLLFTRTLTVLFISIYVVEYVFRIPGLGLISLNAIKQSDIGVILATLLIPAAVAVVGSFLQDVAYVMLDPRVDYDDL